MLFGAEHVKRYIETGGREGHEWAGAHVLILTTTGRRTGELRSTPVIYRRRGDQYVVVASRAGADEHPAWYLNLRAAPRVQVQVLGDSFAADARTATPEEKAELWPSMTQVWPDYDRYQAQTRRDIPVVILAPV